MSGNTRVSRYQKVKPGRLKPIWIYWSKKWWVAVASAGLYAKSAPHPRQPRQHPTTQFFTGRMPFLPPTQQHQTTIITIIIITSPPQSHLGKACHHPKWQLNWFTQFCRSMQQSPRWLQCDAPNSSAKLSLPFDNHHPHLIHSSLDRTHLPSQTTSGSNQPSSAVHFPDRHTDWHTG